MKRGFLLGKFMPPHMGHVLLCETARALVDELTILVCWLPGDPIPGALRLDWMKRLFPDCRVVPHDKIVPQHPSESPDFWPIWKNIMREAHPEPIDTVFASELYGARMAQEVDARFVPIDPAREAVSVSASAIRQNPFAHWSLIPPIVRPYFAKRICLHGPESTGKSVLTARLAKHFQTNFVPEYGRTYCEIFGTNLIDSDLIEIGRVHHAMTGAALEQCNKLLFLDTDPLITAVWSDMMLGRRDAWFDAFDDVADLYLLLDIDLPWIDDGTRIYGGDEERCRFFEKSRAELDRRGVRYTLIQGDGEARFASALVAIESLLSAKTGNSTYD